MKHPLNFFLSILLFAAPAGCKPIPDNPLTGKWLMHQVIQDGEDVTGEHDPYHERYLILREDSTFESGGRPFGMNSGRYVYDPSDQSLFLDSDAGEEDDSSWKVEVRNDTMHWQGLGSEWARAFELIQVREN
jgi:hypothetical protein